jgi:hypothetical protein
MSPLTRANRGVTRQPNDAHPASKLCRIVEVSGLRLECLRDAGGLRIVEAVAA